MTLIELLAPARDLVCGTAAIDHGADAVYIGGPSFGARAAASNPMKDIEKLAVYAHRYFARIYLTLNTILFDDELERAQSIAWDAYNAGVDGLIIQDMGLLELDMPPMMLIASTQMHNVAVPHVRFLESVGFSRVILARELSLDEIRQIRAATSVELEVFVHGSLCVGYSGRCYLSASLGGRSANRGVCGQPCRLPWSLVDGSGRVVAQDRHLLSLKDLDRSPYLKDLMDAGVTSFKIEGRLKDVAYVKNVTAYYRKAIDHIIERDSSLARASSPSCTLCFEPDPERTFHRSRTCFFMNGADDGIASPNTPASTGKTIGKAVRMGPSWLRLDRGADLLTPGDGLCFFDITGRLRGVQVTKVEEEKGVVHVHGALDGLRPGSAVSRNHDHAFVRMLEKGGTAWRRCDVHLVFTETPSGFALKARDEDGLTCTVSAQIPKEPARDPRAALGTIERQLTKSGNTMFRVVSVTIRSKPYFLSVSLINSLRRQVLEGLERMRLASYTRPVRIKAATADVPYPERVLDYRFNVSNTMARRFYERHGVTSIEPAYEISPPGANAVIMTSKHCIRRLVGSCLCTPEGKGMPEPLYLEGWGRRYRLVFDCDTCLMSLISDP